MDSRKKEKLVISKKRSTPEENKALSMWRGKKLPWLYLAEKRKGFCSNRQSKLLAESHRGIPRVPDATVSEKSHREWYKRASVSAHGCHQDGGLTACSRNSVPKVVVAAGAEESFFAGDRSRAGHSGGRWRRHLRLRRRAWPCVLCSLAHGPARHRHKLILLLPTTVTPVGGKSLFSLFSRFLKNVRVPGVDTCLISETAELLSGHLWERRRCHCVHFRARLISPCFLDLRGFKSRRDLNCMYGPRKQSEQACQSLRTGTSRP